MPKNFTAPVISKPKAVRDNKFYFRCRSNPDAPLLILDTYWEAVEMRTHPDYERVDRDGLPLVDEEAEAAEKRIPFDTASRTK